MADVRADPDRMADVARQIETRAADLTEEIDGLERARENLGARWSGAAYEAFEVSHAAWSTTMSDHARTLADAAAAARVAADAYLRADEAVARMWSL